MHRRGEAHHSWREQMTSIYPIIRKLKIMYCIVYETQSAIYGADIPYGFAKGGLHPTASPHSTGTGIVHRMFHS